MLALRAFFAWLRSFIAAALGRQTPQQITAPPQKPAKRHKPKRQKQHPKAPAPAPSTTPTPAAAPAPTTPNAQHDLPYRYLVVVDFECTCVADTTYQKKTPFSHEIIEFPAVVVDLTLGESQDVFARPTFQRFVRPTERPRLSDFCTKLTGISQETVDAAEPLADVLAAFRAWLEEQNLAPGTYAMAADGPWDLRKFLLGECARKHLAADPRWRTWVDVSLHLRKHYDVKRPGNLENKLALLGLAFEGRPHSGLDDARNIARLALRLRRDGCALRVNDGWGDDRLTPRSRTDGERRAARKNGRAEEGRARRGREAARARLHDVSW